MRHLPTPRPAHQATVILTCAAGIAMLVHAALLLARGHLTGTGLACWVLGPVCLYAAATDAITRNRT